MNVTQRGFYGFCCLLRRKLRDVAALCFLGSLLVALPAIGQAEYSAADAANAQRLAKRHCVKCHGEDGRGISEEYASLAGQSADYLLKQLFNFKTGQRQSLKMQAVVNRLSARDSYALSEYFSRLRPAITPSNDEVSKAAGRKLYFDGNTKTGAFNCVSCHGIDAIGGGSVARLAGQNPVYLETQIRKLTDGSRGNDRSMHFINAALNHSEIRNLAIYLAAEK